MVKESVAKDSVDRILLKESVVKDSVDRVFKSERKSSKRSLNKTKVSK